MAGDADLLAVAAAGGVLGALARAGLDAAVPHEPSQWPWSTFLINVAGSLALGLLLEWLLHLAERVPGTRGERWARPFLVTGVLGGFTTFSAYSVQVVDMLESGRLALAALYAVVSVLVAVGAVTVGLLAGRRIWRPGHGVTAGEVDQA